MIKVSSVVKSYGGQVLFKQVSFNLNRRERVGLVGRNGSGKTTLFRLLLGAETPDEGVLTIPKAYHIAHLDQHIRFTRPTVLEEACLGLPESQRHESWRVEKILFGLGFTDYDMQRPPAEYSGGFQVRLNLAKVLVSEPDLLLLDEPTNYLDVVSIRWLSRFLEGWKRELMLITHDRDFMDQVTTHTIGIHRQQVRKIEGGTEKLYQQIAEEEEVYEKTRLNDEKRRKEVELFISRFRAKARLANLVQSRVKTLQRKQKAEQLQKIKTIDFSFSYAGFPSKVALEARDLAFSYGSGMPELFTNFNLTVTRDDRICIVGKNGRGKTTLLRTLAGDLNATRGQIRCHPATQSGYFVQTNLAWLDPEKTVEEEIMLGDPACTRQRARDIAGTMLFSGDYALKKVKVLSGGEKSRVLLGKVLVSSSNLLFLDEPTNHLDMESCDSLLAALDAFEGALVLVTHDEMFLHTLASRLVVFDRDRVILFDGSYQRFLEEVGWDEELPAARQQPVDLETAEIDGKAHDKKALRKEKAQIVQQRSQRLKPLEEEMARLEHEIEKLESEVAGNQKLLIQASGEGNGQRIRELAKTEHDLNIRLDHAYSKLDEVTKTFDRLSEEFEIKLSHFE